MLTGRATVGRGESISVNVPTAELTRFVTLCQALGQAIRSASQKSTILQEAGQLYVLALAVRLVQARADTWNATKMTTATSLGDLLSRTPSYEC